MKAPFRVGRPGCLSALAAALLEPSSVAPLSRSLRAAKFLNAIREKFQAAARLDRVLLGSAFMLGLCMSLEIGTAGSADRMNNPLTAIADSETMLDKPTDVAIYPAPQRVRNWASIALARPLFDRRRSENQKATSAPALPRLAATIISPEGRICIVCSSASHCIIVQEGDRLGEWKFVSIAANSVRLNGPHGIENLKIRYDIDPLSNITTPLTIVADNSTAFPGLNLWPSQLKVLSP